MPGYIEIDKEITTDNSYRASRRSFSFPEPPRRNPKKHGKKLEKSLADSVNAISQYRKDNGIDPYNLLVLEISSDAMEKTLMEKCLTGFDISIQDEVYVNKEEERKKLVVQFKNKDSIDAFNVERKLWAEGSTSDGILTEKQREKFFGSVDDLRPVQREDKYGPKLKRLLETESYDPSGGFFVDFDIWYNPDLESPIQVQRQIEQVLGEGRGLTRDLFPTQTLLLGRLQIDGFRLNALLDMDIVRRVELPFKEESPKGELLTEDFALQVENTLDDFAPTATILDSGIFSGHTLLSPVILGEEDFDLTEKGTYDNNGHGTAVAGLVVYGGFDNFQHGNYIFKPLVRICNAKVMHQQEEQNSTAYADRPEKIIDDAIRYFHEKYNCRIFNLSSGDPDRVYDGSRQMPWAEQLDSLIRELDIVIIVSAGNVNNPEIPKFDTRKDFMKLSRNQLLDSKHRLIDPATSALSITVGSITKFAELSERKHLISKDSPGISPGEENYPSVFTRTGTGVSKTIKPEFVDYGGNYALEDISMNHRRWRHNNSGLSEITLSHTLEKSFTMKCGTSFSAPRVTHIAARVERLLEQELGESPTANLIKAFLATAAGYPSSMRKWVEDAEDPSDKKAKKPAKRMRLVGYGKIESSALLPQQARPLEATDRSVILFAEGTLDLKDFDLYKIPVPKEFISSRGHKRICVGFSCSPPIRANRLEYLANNLQVHTFQRIDKAELIKYVTKQYPYDEKSEESKKNRAKFGESFRAPFKPGVETVMKSTLQQRVWEVSRGGSSLDWKAEREPYIWVLIRGKENFDHPANNQKQPYALAINFSYGDKEDIRLYQRLKEQCKVKERMRVEKRARVQRKSV